MSIVKREEGFTLIEMIFILSTILVILLLVIPVVTSNRSMKEKNCEEQIEVIDNQIILYQIEKGALPRDILDLTSSNPPYLKEKQAICPNGNSIFINEGKAYEK